MSDDDLVTDIIRQRNNAGVQALQGLDTTPDDATRAIALSKASGTDPNVIMGDLDGFNQSNKRNMAAEIIRSNAHLADYVNANPIHGKLSSDDYGQLDGISGKLRSFRKLTSVGEDQSKDILGLPTRAAEGLLGAAWKGFHEGIGEGPIGGWTMTVPQLKGDRLARSLWAAIGSPIELPLRLLSGGERALTEMVKTGAKEAYQTFTGDEQGGERFGRELAGVAQMQLDGIGPQGVRVPAEAVHKAWQALESTKLWLDNGKEPPAGLNPLIDKIKLEQNNADLANLDDLLRDAQRSATRERDPDTFASFIRLRDEGTIAIDGEAVAKLYGDKLPDIEDGILGWSDGIAAQLETARVAGGDVEIPLALWLAKVDPEVAKALHDDIRVRPGGITKNEAKITAERRKELKALHPEAIGEPAILPEDLPQLRAHAGLEPLFSIGDRKLKIEKAPSMSLEEATAKAKARVEADGLDWDKISDDHRRSAISNSYPITQGMEGIHDFRMLDENGQTVGMLNLSEQKDGKQLYVDMIQGGPPGSKLYNPNSMGPALMRDLLRQIKEAFPNAESITGHRVSGAREKAESYMKPSANPVVKLDAPDIAQLRQLFTDRQFKPLDSNIEAVYKPTKLLTERELELSDAIGEELARLTPKQADVSTPSAMRRTADKREVFGAHVSYTDRNPFIIVSLDAPHPIGTARHEAIHHLRQQGFFTEGEWNVLSRAARDNGWIEKFGIERKYAKLETSAKLEEAIAEGFRDWKEGKPTPQAAVTIFERLKELFDAIKARLKEIFGREITWEELFQKVDEGEVGQREGNAPRREGAYRESVGAKIDTPEFNNWFGNSVTKDANGPIEYYTGTSKDKDFTTFKVGRHGTWFTRDPKEASQYAVENDSMGFKFESRGYEKTNTASRVIPAYIKAENPYKGDPPESIRSVSNYKKAQSDWFDQLRREGYDSWIPDSAEGNLVVVLKEPTQIKSSTGNRGTFDPNKGDVRFSVGEPELPNTTRMEDRPLFRTPATIGMTAKQVALYERRLAEMQEADAAFSQARAEKEQKKRLTAEWKQAKKEIHSQVEAEMNQRPDVAADLFFGRGELYGEKLDQKYKIAFEDLTPEQRAQLPKDYVAKEGMGGVELDDVASLVGYPSGQAMIAHLTAYNAQKLAANMSAKAFRDRMVDLETERQMAGKFGNLEENILDAVKDQVTSESQLNLISEEILALGIRAGAEASINKFELKAWVQEKFGESLMAGQSSDKFLKAAGKGGQAAEIALLKGEFDTAYRAKQSQFMAVSLAKEARALEKEQAKFAKTVGKLSKRDVKGLSNDYQDAIQMLLWQSGIPTKRTMPEIQRSQAISGKDLTTLVDEALGDGWSPGVSADILAGRIKQMDEMTVDEFREFKEAIDSLNHIGRQVEKIDIKGRQEDFQAYKDQVIANISTLPIRPRDKQESGLAHRIYSIDAALTRMENVMKDLDLGEDMGPLVEATIRPLAEAKHKEYSMQEGLSTQIKALNESLPADWKKSLDQDVPNDWFVNPGDGVPFKMTRADMINVMLNWGNKSNLEKFTRSYGSKTPGRMGTKDDGLAFKAKMDAWLGQHATAEDWKFVQGIWDIYKGYRTEMETVWWNTSGTQPRLIEAVPVQMPHGTFEGGYYPLIRDPYLSEPPKAKAAEQALFGPDYPNFNTPQGYLKGRTGAAYYVDFQQPIARIPVRMQQVIHDIAYRAEIMATAKVVRDPAIQKAISNHYGKEYTDQLEPWLKKTARGSTFDEANQKGIDGILRKARLNLVGYALPFNYVVTLTPDVGSINPLAMRRFYADYEANVALANRVSKEIPHAMYNMDRDFKEAMMRAVNEGKIDAYRAKVSRWGYGPVSWASKQFRMVTFIDKYNAALADGKSEADAAAIADTFVRERHGAVALHDMPSVMTSGEKGRMLTVFYGYFNTHYNLARTIPAHLRRGDNAKALEAAWGSIIVGAFFGAMIANTAKEEDSYLWRGAKAIPLQLLGMVPFVREGATLAIEGIPPRTPVGSVLQASVGAARDVVKYVQGKPINNGVKHMAAVAGLVGGIPGTLQAGRTGQFLWDVNTGKQRPRDIYEWVRGVLTGEARLKRQGER